MRKIVFSLVFLVLNQKMTKLFVFVLSLCLFFSYGCNISKKENSAFQTITIPRTIDADNADIIENLEYIVLEEKENSYLGQIAKMRVFQNKIFVLDLMASAVFIYTIDGKHIATIGDKKGRGPMEFVSVTNFEIDYINHQLVVMDNFGYKFMVYDLDGGFVKQIDSDVTVVDAVLLSNGYIVHAKPSWEHYRISNECDYIIIADENKQIVKEGFQYDDNKNVNIRIYDVISSQLDGSINFAPKFRDTIYTVSFDSIFPKYAINYGDNRSIPKNVIEDIPSPRELYQLINNGSLCFIGEHVEAKDHIYLSLGYVLKSTTVFYNKQTNNTIALSHKKYSELYRILCSDSDGYFYGVFNITTIDDLFKLFPDLQKLDQSKDMNPILFRYKVKI